jgi:CO/xanthine dehydrogenase Mo-binding subunit
MAMAGMCYAALVRSDVSRGRIRSIDMSAALAMEGVLGGVTGKDLTREGVVHPHFGLAVIDQPILTDELVRFAGEPVAAVVAETMAQAERAASMVVVDIEPDEPILSVEDALTHAESVHPERPSADPNRANVAARIEYSGGDVDAALASAHFVHEATYRFPMVAHYPMEPHCCIASWDAADLNTLDVVSGTQSAFKVRADLARIFGLRLNDVRVRTGYVGGGFGGKLLCKYEPLAAVLARAVRRPVQVLASAEDSFRTIARHGAVVRMRTGVDENGNLVARDTEVLFDTGAYADKGPGVAKKAAYRAKGPYEIPNFRSVALAVYTNKVPGGAFRGYSTPQVAWAGESAINEIAEHLGEDPLEFRQRRLVPRGGEFMPHDTPMDADLVQGLTMAADALGWGAALQPGRGRGVATGVKDGGGGPSRAEAEVRLHSDGSVEVLTSTSEIGQGSLTVFGQMAAEELRCHIDRVRTRLPDTNTTPFDHATEASRSTVLVGNAVRNAARNVADQLREILRDQAGGKDDFSLVGDRVRIDGEKDRLLADVMSVSRHIPLPQLEAGGTPKPREYELGPITGLGYHLTLHGVDSPLGTPSNFYEVGHGAAEVDVDEETGQVRLVKYVSVSDVGKAINPQTCHAQDDGAAIMAIGHTMIEEMHFEEGHLVNANLADYTLPRFEDLPEEGLTSMLLENEDGPGPWGAKGGGEGGIIPVSPAVAAAVHQAIGVRMRELPLTPERVWRALREREAQANREDSAR